MPTRLQHRLEQQQSLLIDLSPLLDVVFILLIFFIVTTAFVRETGVKVDKPQAVSAQKISENAILVAITDAGEVFYEGAQIGVSGVQSTIEQLQLGRKRPVVIQADKAVSADVLLKVIDAVKLAGTETVNLAALRP